MSLVLLLTASTERDSSQTLWNELLMLMTKFCRRRRQEVKGRPGKQWLKESVVDNGLSAVSITREQENKQYQRESWVKEKATIIDTSIS